MKKSNLILLIALIVLIGVVVVVYFHDKGETKSVFRDFVVEDTASVDKIFLADRNSSVTLERINNVWMVNGKYSARKDYINVLLTTMRNLEVTAPVPEAKLDKVLKDLSVTGIKTQIYQNGKLYKTYYVGGVTPDNTGTYMIMEGSELPFVTHLPGFTGYLTVRYLPDVKEWRERIIFDYKFNQIAKITVEYPVKGKNVGFIINNYGNNSFEITKLNGSDVDFNVDTLKVKEYIGKIKFIAFEAFITEELQKPKLDSLNKEPVVAKFEIEDREGKINSFRTYFRPNINKAFDDEGNLYDWDIDRLYGVVYDNPEVVLMQYYILDPISWDINNFKIKN